jgi:PadR family transcriptional regulator PadR
LQANSGERLVARLVQRRAIRQQTLARFKKERGGLPSVLGGKTTHANCGVGRQHWTPSAHLVDKSKEFGLPYFRYSISKSDILMCLTEINSTKGQELLSGLIRIHILYHACKEPIFGLGMIEELQRHGYKLSAGTLYPMLHGLERKGLLRSRKLRIGRISRRIYRATATGQRTLARAREKVKLLLGELLE